MATHYTQAKPQDSACVDRNAEKHGSTADNNGALWYPTEMECGSIPTPPCVQDREVTCVVCTR
jgi:hypothetical protein